MIVDLFQWPSGSGNTVLTDGRLFSLVSAQRGVL